MAAQTRDRPFTTNVDAGSKSPPSAAAGAASSRPPDS